ncbi:hypothetical protein SANTM175S_06839 [Streptomyces antimycoticus]
MLGTELEENVGGQPDQRLASGGQGGLPVLFGPRTAALTAQPMGFGELGQGVGGVRQAVSPGEHPADLGQLGDAHVEQVRVVEVAGRVQQGPAD